MLYLSDTCIIISSSYFAISLIKQSNISKEQLAVFLFNISKEALHDYLNESKTLKNQHKLTKNKMIELIINDTTITEKDIISSLTNNTKK